ncbi:hypothetical protein KC734_01415 [candidate division KSB1 bacterium]|nr:hypothetical protein [candidate division KSB1 bacterium]
MTATAKQKTLTGTITFMVIAGIHLFMFLANIPSRDFSKIYEKLDDKVWTQFLPQKIQPEEIEPEKIEPQKIEPPKERVETTPVLQPSPIQRERFDPEKLNTRLQLGRLQQTPTVSDAASKREQQASPAAPSRQRAAFSQTQFRLIDGSAGSLPALPSKTGSAASQAIQAGRGKSLQNSAPEFQGSGSTPEIPQEPSGQVATPELALGDFNRNKIEVSEIFRALIEWVRRHPAELSPVLKQFLGYREGGLTSKVQFSINRRHFELFLLCFEGNYEVRIALVEKSEIIYLIDQGFVKESQKLRAGTVTRLPASSEIATIETQPLPIGHAKNAEFYDLFLSWWESVKHEVEK